MAVKPRKRRAHKAPASSQNAADTAGRRPTPRRRTSRHAAWTREAYLVDALAQLEDATEQAILGQSWVAVGQLKKQAITCRAELDTIRETARRAAAVAPLPVAQHKLEILAEVRRLRQGATESGSWVAAAGLLRLEREMIATTIEEARKADDDRLASMPDSEMIAEIEELMAQLAPEERAAILRRSV